MEPGLADIILQEALVKAKKLNRDYDRLCNSAVHLVKGKPSAMLKAQLSGFFSDLINNVSDFDTYTFAEDVEQLLYDHAKYRHISVAKALETLEKVDNMIFSYTFKTSISRTKYVKESNEILHALRKNQGNILIPY